MIKQMMKPLLMAGAALTLAACTSLPGAAPAKDAFPNYASEAVTPDFDAGKVAALEARMAQFVTDGDVPGIATLLVKDGQVISHTRAGIRRASDKAPVEDDTIYRIYSMSKPITGVALMTLYEDGKFSLDDPVSKFIPEFENLQVVKSYDASGVVLEPLTRQPTMRELMSHTAGFAYGLFGDDPSNTAFRERQIMRSPDLGALVDNVAGVPLIAQPGEQWFYSVSVDLQGAVIERLSGMTLGEYFNAEIFTPLGMVDTGFYVPEAKYERFGDAFGYDPKTKKLVPVPLPSVAYRKDTIAMESGGGGLTSTMRDYARFSQMMANGGELNGARILKPETVKLMRTDVLTDQTVNIGGTLSQAQIDSLGFGLDLGIIKNPANVAGVHGDGSYFWGGAAGTWFWVDPVNDLFFIGMIQRFTRGGPPVDFRGISADMVYDALQTDGE
jgi:CubicO group peptidase (beta-lactamase class C family)